VPSPRGRCTARKHVLCAQPARSWLPGLTRLEVCALMSLERAAADDDAARDGVVVPLVS
jgi:hypothetical protein